MTQFFFLFTKSKGKHGYSKNAGMNYDENQHVFGNQAT